MKTVYDVLIEKLEEAKLSSMQFLVDGAAKDYAEYQNLCGVIRGLRSAQMEVQDLESRIKEDEDE